MKISTTITSLTIIGGITNLVMVTGHEAMKLDASLPTKTKEQLQNSRRNTSVGEVNDDGITTIRLGQDVDYPPFAYQTPNGELAGFGLDIANGMNDLCEDINIVVVQEAWENCWTSDNQVGSSIASGKLDGCMTYTHSVGVRDERADFSDAILQDNQAAGLLTLLDDDGNPLISGLDNISGRTIIDVGGWAPTADALQFVMNKWYVLCCMLSCYYMLTSHNFVALVQIKCLIKIIQSSLPKVMWQMMLQFRCYSTERGKQSYSMHPLLANLNSVRTDKLGTVHSGKALVKSMHMYKLESLVTSSTALH